jgi:signal transduction histidine kinase/CheY-like chemotaxis protein
MLDSIRLGESAEEPGQTPLDDGALFVSTAAARGTERRLALALILVLAAGFAAAAPFARTRLPEVPAFIPVYETALTILDLVTAIILFGQFAMLRGGALLALAGGYLFSGLMTIAHALTFPGLFAAHGLLGAGPQSTAWLYMFWHGGFAAAVMAYALLQRRDPDRDPFGAAPWAAVFGCAAAVVALVCGLTWLATAGAPALPAIMAGNRYTAAMIFVVGTVWLLGLLGVAIFWLRRPLTILDAWLMAVLTAWVFDIGLSAVFNAGRFDLGFYAGRVYGLLATSFVLAVMLIETSRLYGRLAQAATRLSGRVGTLEASERAHLIELERSNSELREEVAERRRTEAQLVQAQKMEAIGNLTGGMAHDFNNILGVVIGNLDLLRERCTDDPEAEELAGEAMQAALRGADLNRRLLAFARRQPLQPARVDLNALVDGIVTLLRRILGEQVEIVLDPEAETWPVVADATQLEAAVTNLATNARDAMPKGGKLTIATGNRHLDPDYAAQHPEVTPGDYALIEVSDNGTGMPRDVMSRIFEPFFTTKEQGKGTGLGLSMVFGFIKQSGGHITVYSEPGIGTTFRLYLPRALAGSLAAEAAAAAAAAPGSGERVLVVEDNIGLRRVAVRQLRELGYETVEAESAAAAVAALEDGGADLVFSDVVLPGGADGFDLAAEIGRRWPEIPVLLTSGFTGGRLERSLAGLSPTVRFLGKPYRKTELATALQAVLEAPAQRSTQ